MQFRDPARETMAQETRQNYLTRKLESVNELRNNSFNIVNHHGPTRKFDEMLKARKEDFDNNKHQIRPHHLLTNLPHTAHKKAPLQYNEEGTLKLLSESYKNSRLTLHHENLKSAGKSREFNIISNDFYTNPEERKQEEYQKLKNHVLQKYWDTHDFDPIKGQYYSAEKEERYKQQKQILSEVYGKSKELSIPPSIQYAESSSYNIVNHDIKDDFKLTISNTSHNRSLNRMNKLDREATMIEDEEAKKERQDSKHKNRIKFRRWETEIDRGYDIVKNQVINNPHVPVPQRPSTMWDRLSTANANQNTAGGFSRTVIDQFPQNPNPSKPSTSYGNQFNETNGESNSQRGRNLAGGQLADDNYSYYSLGTGTSQQNNNNNFQDAGSVVGGGAKTQRAQTSNLVSARNSGRDKMKPLSSNSVPRLDLTKTDYGEPVSYQEPAKGPPGLSIPIVRTGGMSNYN